MCVGGGGGDEGGRRSREIHLTGENNYGFTAE